MKIGILTLPLRTNSGGLLQAYALQEVLKRMGHEVWMLNKQKKMSKGRLMLAYIKRVIKKIFINKNELIFVEKHNDIIFNKISRNTQEFITNYLVPISKVYHTTADLKSLNNEGYDAIIVGSDQVWRPKYTPNIYDYFLSFCRKKSIKKISYAASFGTDVWEFTSSQTQRCKKMLQNFSAISVRENSAVKNCNDYFNVSAEHVLDPTMLLEADDYLALVENSITEKKEGELLLYLLDEPEKKKNAIDTICNYFRYDYFSISSKVEVKEASIESRVVYPIPVWLRGFHDAKFVLTDSFHGCVFSIIFNKPFFVLGNKTRGLARFDSLLEMFDLQDRLIESEKDLTDEKIGMKIDWKKVNSLLDKQRARSFSFLKKSLKD